MLRKGTLPYLARGRDKQPPAQTDNTEKQTGEQTTQGTEGAKPAQGLKPTPHLAVTTEQSPQGTFRISNFRTIAAIAGIASSTSHYH